MKYLSIIEKLLCLFDVVKSSWWNLAFVGILLILVILTWRKVISKKVFLGFVLVSYLGLLGMTIYSYIQPLSKTANSINDHFFTNVYFPSVYVYLFVLIFINVVVIASFLKKGQTKAYRTVHGIFSFLINFIFTLILKIVAMENVDVFSKTSLFANTDLVVLLELSVQLFILWLMANVVVFLTNVIYERVVLSKKKEEVLPVNVKTVMELGTSEEELQEDYLGSTTTNVSATEQSSVMPIDTSYHFVPPMESYSSSFEMNTVEGDSTSSYVPTREMQAGNEAGGSSVNQGNPFDLSSFIPKQQTNVFIPAYETLNKEDSRRESSSETNLVFEQILKNELPMIQEEVVTTPTAEELERDSYTLNDYRIFNKMLKEIKDHNQNNTVYIDKNLEYRLITKYSDATYAMFKKMLKNYSN